ncbi:MAG: NAD(P)-binding domain-containing protein [bacterium]|nr:NAD(P)-binding domain-containing protein [bacterium]
MAAKMRVSDADVAKLLTPTDFVSSCDDAFRLYGSGEMLNPARNESMTREGGLEVFRLELPGEWVGRFRARKVIVERSNPLTGRLGERTAVIELEDLTGQTLCLFDAEYITNMRTGAAGVLAVKYLGRLPIRKLSILGTGRIARALALCADAVLRPETICVTSRKPESRHAFAEEIGPRLGCELLLSPTIEACVSHSDAILAAVPTATPVLTRAMVASGTHISVLGGDPRTEQLDPELFLSRPLLPDHANQVLQSGEFLAAEKAGRQAKWVTGTAGEKKDIGHAALGKLENLRGKGAIVYFSGMAIQDLHAASVAWERFRDRIF